MLVIISHKALLLPIINIDFNIPYYCLDLYSCFVWDLGINIIKKK